MFDKKSVDFKINDGVIKVKYEIWTSNFVKMTNFLFEGNASKLELKSKKLESI